MRLTVFLFILLWVVLPSAVRGQNESYVPETDPLVLKTLDEWQDMKFGFMMHWGPYSQWGVVESWSICSEDVDWCRRPKGISYVDYVKKYEELPKTFDPASFDPEGWARLAKDAGMRYLVFTAKHHTKYSDYKITGPDVPFRKHPKANILKSLFDAFRKEGLGIGVYFSKPDWHHDDYWAPEWATPDRNVNYDTAKYPERWQRFRDFMFNQLNELTTEYGKVDIIWLDGGWVRPGKPKDPIAGSGRVPWEQDVDLPRIAAMARKNQPGIIIVDRDVHGHFENYRTPEQRVPEKPLPYPWETCMTMGNSWSYVPNDVYKPTRHLIHLLVDIVAKGGNFLLNVGPSPKGELPAEARKRMREIGEWMKVNGDAIYKTRPIAPYKEGKISFTALRDGTVNAIYLADEGEEAPPTQIRITGVMPRSRARLRMLGNDVDLKWKVVNGGVSVEIPESIRRSPPSKHAWTIVIPK